jgi:hypothetical protein
MSLILRRPKFDGLEGEPGDWMEEGKGELEDPLYRTALELKPRIYVENINQAANEELLDLGFEKEHMLHIAFIHGHAHWPPLLSEESVVERDSVGRQYYGSFQLAVFDGPRVWRKDVYDLIKSCLVRIAAVMKAYGETAPALHETQNQ